MNQKRLSVGIVGAGSIFNKHAAAYRELAVPMAGVADVDRKRADQAASKHSIPLATGDWRDLVAAAEVDVVDICTPPKFHAEIAIAALQAGKYVICEKPLAPNLAEIDQIIEAERHAPGKLAVVHQWRFRPGYQRLKWLVSEGHLGRVCFARGVLYDRLPAHLVERGLWGSWDLTGGGVLMTKGIHALDQLCWLLGRVKRVQAMIGTFISSIESDDHALAQIEFESGAIATFCVSAFPYQRVEQLDLLGDQGSASLSWGLQLNDSARQPRIQAELDRRFPLAAGGSDADGRSLWSRVARKLGLKAAAAPPESGHVPFLRETISAFQSAGRVPATADEARQAVELCTAIYSSALLGEAVELPLTESARFYGGICKNDYLCTS